MSWQVIGHDSSSGVASIGLTSFSRKETADTFEFELTFKLKAVLP